MLARGTVGLLAVAWQTNFLQIRDVVNLVLNGEIKAAFDLFIANLSAMTLAIAVADTIAAKRLKTPSIK